MTISDRARVTLSAVAFAAALGGGAASAHDDLAPAIEQLNGQVSGVRPPPPERWQVAAGFRTALFHSAGYDPFATDDAFTSFALTASRALPTGPALATAFGVAWDAGGVDATARGSDTSLSLSRLGGLIEERWSPRQGLYAYARLSPAWLRGTAEVKDPTLPAALRTTFSTFSLDASLGGAVRVNQRSSRVGLWLVAEAGYGWAPEQRIALAPALPASDAAKAGVTTFADFAPRGVFFRGGVALGF